MPYDAKSTPRPPDCETSASGPGTWPLSSHAASNDSWPLHTPMQFGPSSTAPAARTRAATRVLDRAALLPRLREADRDADERPHAARQPVLDDLLEGAAPAPPAPPGRPVLPGRAATPPSACPCTVGLRALTSSTRRRSEPRSTPARDAEPPLGRVVGRPDDRDRARVQQRREVSHLNIERPMIRRWMSDVPSYSSSSLAARSHRSTGYSRE